MEPKLDDGSGGLTSAFALRRLLENAAADRGLSNLQVLATLLFPALVGAVGVILLLFNRHLYHLYTMEDGITEDGQVAFYVVALILAFATGVRLYRKQWLTLSLLYLGLAAGLFFLAGEEISWGQRVFNWITPEWLADVNQQHETTIHNIYGISAAFQWSQLIIAGYGGLLPLVIPSIRALAPHRKLISFLVPHYLLVPYFLPHFFWRIYRNFFQLPHHDFRAIAEFNEVFELNLAAGFFLFTLYQWRRLTRRPFETPVE